MTVNWVSPALRLSGILASALCISGLLGAVPARGDVAITDIAITDVSMEEVSWSGNPEVRITLTSPARPTVDALRWCIDGSLLPPSASSVVRDKPPYYVYLQLDPALAKPGEHVLTAETVATGSSPTEPCTGMGLPITVRYAAGPVITTTPTARAGKPVTVRGLVAYGTLGLPKCKQCYVAIRQALPLMWRIRQGDGSWTAPKRTVSRPNGSFTITTPPLKATSTLEVWLPKSRDPHLAASSAWKMPTTIPVRVTSRPLSSTDQKFIAALKRESSVFSNLPTADLIKNARLSCSLMRQGASPTSVYESDVRIGFTPEQAYALVSLGIAYYCPEIQ